jgi:hypothetical protein
MRKRKRKRRKIKIIPRDRPPLYQRDETIAICATTCGV